MSNQNKMYMAKYLSQPTHPSLSPGSGPMPDFCVVMHPAGRGGGGVDGGGMHVCGIAFALCAGFINLGRNRRVDKKIDPNCSF
jgi:hypothetical protein